MSLPSDESLLKRRTAYACCIGNTAKAVRLARSRGRTELVAKLTEQQITLMWALGVLTAFPIGAETCNAQYIPDEDIVCCAIKMADPCCVKFGCAEPTPPAPFDCTITPNHTAIAEDAEFQDSALPATYYFIVSNTNSVSNIWSGHLNELVFSGVFTALPEGSIILDPNTTILWTIGGGVAGHLYPIVDMQIMVGGDYVLTSRYPNVNANRTWNIQIEGSVDGITWVPLYTGPETALADPLLVTNVEGLLEVRIYYRFGLCDYGPFAGTVTLGPFFSFVSTDDTAVDFILRSTTGYVTVELWDGTQAQYGAGNPAADIVLSPAVPGTGPYSGNAPKTITVWSILNGNLLNASGAVSKFVSTDQDITEAFLLREPGMKEWRAHVNQIEELEFAPAADPTIIQMEDNDLTEFAIDSNALTSLRVHQNQLTTVSVAGCEATLVGFYVYQNQLTTIAVPNFTALVDFRCNNNLLTTIDMTGCTGMLTFHGYQNSFATIDITPLVNVTSVLLYLNQLSTLDTSANVDLITLQVDRNQLTALDLSTNVLLQTLNASQNLLTALDTATNVDLLVLIASSNAITSLDLSTNVDLVYVQVNNNALTTLGLAANTALLTLIAHHNAITTIDLSTNTALIQLDVSFNELTALNISANTLLQTLDCSFNDIGTLDTSTNAALTTIRAESCGLTAFDPSNNPLLSILNVQTNGITTVDFSANAALTNVRLGDNDLTGTLDLSGKASLVSLLLQGNPALTTLDCSNCAIQNLYIFNCIGLSSINASGNAIPSLGPFGIDTLFQTLDPALAGTIDVSGGTNGPPTAASLVKRNQLLAGGWTITTN